MNRVLPVRNKLKKAFQGKTVMGSSAGAIFLAKYFYDQNYKDIQKGFNILPVKILTHYLSTGKYAPRSGKNVLDKLTRYKERLPVYAIKETEYIIKKFNL